MEQTECIEACLGGKHEAYRVLVERYQRPLLALVRGRGANPENAEEIVQEAFVRGYVNLRKLGKRESFFPWVVGIAQRVSHELIRDSARQRDLAKQSFCANPRTITSDDEMPDIELEQAVANLPEPYREVVLLRYYGGLSCNEVADQLQMPLGSVTKTLSRAYGMLREQLLANSGVRTLETKGRAI